MEDELTGAEAKGASKAEKAAIVISSLTPASNGSADNMVFTSPIPAPFVGVDRSALVPIETRDSPKVIEDESKGKLWPNPMMDWMKELYTRSNFTFASIYLQSHQKQELQYPTSACKYGRGHTLYYNQLASQGWGAWFVYATYTRIWDTHDESHPRIATLNRYPDNLIRIAEQRAILHGKQIKEIVQAFTDDSIGSVVYIDSEGAGVPTDLATYFSFLFKEMVTLRDDGLQPVRPGLYAEASTVTELLTTHAKLFEDFTDLFLFLRTGTDPKDPFTSEPSKVEFDTKSKPIWVCTSTGKRVFLPVGEQVVLNYERNVPHGGMHDDPPVKVDPALLKVLPRYQTWDFNASFVRDPRFPDAYPRFTLQRNVLVCGLFNKLRRSMTLEQRSPQKGLLDASGLTVQLEAPILMTSSLDLFSINSLGLVLTSHRTITNTWTPLAPLPTTSSDPKLRRLRAIAALSPDHKEPQLFYISHDFKIYARRKPSGQAWTAPKQFVPKLSTYFFSTVTSTVGYSTKGTETTEVFFINSAKSLSCATATFPPTTDWPGEQYTTLEGTTTLPGTVSIPIPPSLVSKPALLPGTALIAISPSRNHTLVFGISKTHELYMAARTNATQAWTALQRVIYQPVDCFIHPHSKLAILSPVLERVLVAGLTEAGVPCIYFLRFDGTKWVSIGLTVYRRFPAPKDSKKWKDPMDMRFDNAVVDNRSHREALGIANSWNFNPCGDVELGMEGTDVVLVVAACAPDRVGLLKRRITRPDEGWWLVDENGKSVPAGGP